MTPLYEDENDRQDFCRILSQTAEEIWQDLKADTQFDSPISSALDEEPLTASIVRRLARRFSDKSRVITNIRTFTKAEEAVRGADWEFIFRTGDRYTLWRFQAKRIHYIKGRPAYRFDDQGRNKLTEQPARLISFAKIDQATPMYMFYNFFGPSMFGLGVQCHTDINLPMSAFGISLCHAEVVLKKLSSQKGRYHYLDDSESLAAESCAMECLFCRSHTEPLSKTIDSALGSLFNHKVLNGLGESGIQPSFAEDQLPKHVSSILPLLAGTGFEQDTALPREFGGVRGIVYLDA